MIIKRIINRIYRTPKKIRRYIIETWINKTKKRPFIFKDWNNDFYIQMLGDDKLPFKNVLEYNAVIDSIKIVKLINKLVQDDWICIDIGANIGGISVPMWKKVLPKGRVYTIEADPNNINRIKMNLLLNGFSDDFVYNYAICDKNEDVELNIIPGSNGWQSLGNPRSDPRLSDVTNSIYSEIVNGKTLEEFCDSQSIKKIDFLKIDVEGAELEVFKGGNRLLKEHMIKYIVFEIGPLMLKWFDDNRTEKQILDCIAKYNYKLYDISNKGNIIKLANKPCLRGSRDCLAVAPTIKLPSHLLKEAK